jgi:hypothetical protein
MPWLFVPVPSYVLRTDGINHLLAFFFWVILAAADRWDQPE